MSSREHSHYEDYYTRIIRRGGKEWIQMICISDGAIFEEHVIHDEATDSC